MKIFENVNKVNFVDVNNVFVGYDLSTNCCEYADWFISDKKQDCKFDNNGKIIKMIVLDIDEFIFDTNFFEIIENNKHLDDGRMVIFKIIKNNKELFLHLFNMHNGYYAHGFSAKINNQKWQEDYL